MGEKQHWDKSDYRTGCKRLHREVHVSTIRPELQQQW